MQLTEIKGIGEKRAAQLAQAGIFTPIDLLMRFPYKYADLHLPPDFDNADDGEEVVFIGEPSSEPVLRFIRKGLNMLSVTFATQSGEAKCVWFNQPYQKKRLQPGKRFIVSGKVKRFKNGFSISAPQLAPYRDAPKGIVPLYRSVRGLPTGVLTDAIAEVLRAVRLAGYIPAELAEKHGMMPLLDAFCEIHNPTDIAKTAIAGRTVAVENLSYTLSIFSVFKRQNRGNRVFRYLEKSAELQKVIKSLPFELTKDQSAALKDILESLHKDERMNRLLQGDVGCGKTVIALLAMFYAHLSGFQSVLMAPTELLARQHFMSAVALLEGFGAKAELITGSQTKRERDDALFRIEHGMSDIIIGTHALIQQGVTFCNLSLVITDEQHRFGVSQRALLENKSQGTDTLVMSATPIPRTLALTLYGDLEQSRIYTLPRGKAQIFTRPVPPSKRDDMLRYVLKKAESGEQTYIVCPRIEAEDGLVSVEEVFAEMKALCKKTGSGSGKSVTVGMLHGQMKESEKNAVMSDFSDGKTDILVTTTVIEVGIDVPNATTMIIFCAERYGLSQLHQLRGRVGRGQTDSYCFLLSDNENTSTLARLEYFCGCADGFRLAEYDFKQRGAGDFIGTRQHGDTTGAAAVPITTEIIDTAKEISAYLLTRQDVCDSLVAGVGTGGGEYIKSLTLN